MKKTVFIFDFDGTIADSLHMGIEIFNKHIANKYNCKSIDTDNIEELKGKSTYELLKEHKINILKVPLLLYVAKKLMEEKMGEIELIEGMKEALKGLKNKGFRMGILTSNNKKNVELFLIHHGLEDLFEFVYSEKNLFGKDKAIKKMINTEKLEDIIYVGDETRDVEACKKVGVPVIGVSWGFNTKINLEAHKPNYLISSPQELVKIGEKIEKNE
ncbi:MAG: HAD-IA family hydrolase [Psychrilyobacter sp.]|nr:HAD-IA family hydrolase [Psychrilyobacter sp.]